jgi:hypothetical protein
MSPSVAANLEAVRQEWEDGYRRFSVMASDSRSRSRLYKELEVVSDQLKRRVGQKFTIIEAVDAYRDAENWAAEAMAEHVPGRTWSRDLTIVIDAAFHLYARAAVDYEP